MVEKPPEKRCQVGPSVAKSQNLRVRSQVDYERFVLEGKYFWEKHLGWFGSHVLKPPTI